MKESKNWTKANRAGMNLYLVKKRTHGRTHPALTHSKNKTKPHKFNIIPIVKKSKLLSVESSKEFERYRKDNCNWQTIRLPVCRNESKTLRNQQKKTNNKYQKTLDYSKNKKVIFSMEYREKLGVLKRPHRTQIVKQIIAAANCCRRCPVTRCYRTTTNHDTTPTDLHVEKL